ncbi:hypothetical protein [Streptomyces sp. NPDC101249]|uniref:hypothetical protein n=1 Tax=Streptomyces sp. NPDC101249 TaxID=3366140 RepID=UPI003805DD9B
MIDDLMAPQLLSQFTAGRVHLSVEQERDMARQALTKAEQADTHDGVAMAGTSVSLSIRLAALLAALDEEEGQ